MMKKENTKLCDDDWLKNDLLHSMNSLLSVSTFKNYRMIPLYPTEEDLHSSKPSALCANKVDCPYKNCEEYLDTFFRLIREDFVSIVRDVYGYLYNNRNTLNLNVLESKKIWYYSNVKIHCIIRKSSVIVFEFDSPDRAKKIDYENSEKFKNGALILLSMDRFETYTLGIVVETYNINRGRVGVDVVGYKNVENWSQIDLVELSVFYEPYRYIMGVFQDMNETNFPMKEYIVYGHKIISFPKYLAENSVYKINGIEFDILKHDQWPSAEVLNMDINQYDAFKGALIKEFAMIQGPPGTGKTYIGLEIIKIILENMYYTNKLKNPILVVCMTNHALDQFLEGIWKITKNIFRFGRGTKSEILENFIPKINPNKKNDSYANVLVKAKRDAAALRNEGNIHAFKISEVDRNLGILDLSNLMDVLISEGYNNWFQESYDLFSWLLFDISYVEGVNPIDFIKTNNLLSVLSTNIFSDPIQNKFYCISLERIKLYCTKVQYQLSKLNIEDDDLSEKNHLQLTLKVMKTVKEYIIKHLKLYKSSSFVTFYNRLIVESHHCLKIRDRWLLYYSWIHSFIMMENKNLEDLHDSILNCKKRADKFKSIRYWKPVKDKYVIGMTTTAAAKNRFLMKKLKCPIVIIEEAAEVLEPHIVSSLSEHCEHLILIGDHKQLRPQTANHMMSKKYNLDISLFERMVNNGIPSYTLAEQHRMRPEIAGLVAPVIYPHLRNHPSVEDRPHVIGVDKDVFCITHNVHENKDYKLSSFKNENEAKFLVALADYLLKQGYYSEDITIMAMYNAQVSYISDLIKLPIYEHLENIRITSVDGYQGEENEIVLLSLVRSNNINSVGFLKTDNRVCVALSRARLGFFMTGDLNLLSRKSNLWKKIKKYLQYLNAIGPALLLKCQNHNNILGKVSNHLDFCNLNLCKLKCNSKLQCGHLCDKSCHIDDGGHLGVKCLKACDKKCSRNHRCHKMCYEKCKCEVIINEICEYGHKTQGKCCEVENNKCLIKVNENLNCGHSIEKNCFEPSICNKICNKPNPNCLFRHLCKNPCRVICGSCDHIIHKIMECGHISESACSQILADTLCKKCKVC
ncbi:Hypothetical protein CINCED_3A008626 [Cinara cedri]|uniref:P-loop containing nucleoside triphosphate hydrolase n=1 Tax=Cinara cedri TaxID=506608 RepID=A0A5E4N6T9_9HEMI|nr:Hypothetical protein CINCED_3A008626 [Cinara cedri]